MNTVEISGGLVRDPELRFTPGGAAVCEFTVAVNDAQWSSEASAQVVRTTFVSCQAWLWMAEQITEMSLHKGDEVYVKGKLQQRTVERGNGKKEQKTRVEVMFLQPLRVREYVATSATVVDETEPF